MAHSLASTVLGHFRKLVEADNRNNLPDRELLAQFLSRHDDAAFAVLVQRHGTIVWAVCQHVLGHLHDAEDAFQATFLVLARRASAIRKSDSLGCWLHGVARRIAVRMKTRSRRAEGQLPVPVRAQATPAEEAATQEFCWVVQQELSRLPQRYRAPLLLCGIDGKTRAEANDHFRGPLATGLGTPEATAPAGRASEAGRGSLPVRCRRASRAAAATGGLESSSRYSRSGM
jgi:RNA polymerase sigma factor (sigma-70 family)